MNIFSIKDYDINNGEGIRVSLWISGCPHRCEGCHNQSAWNKDVGVPFQQKHIDKILEKLEEGVSKDFSVLGGEPLAPYNIEDVTKVCKIVKEKYPNKKIWLWTGYSFEDIQDKEVLKYIDVLIDGKFIEELYDKDLMWRGSSNQRIIDVKENKII